MPATTSLCPECGHDKISTIDSRKDKGEWRRRRKRCEACRHRWSTLEIPESELANLLSCREMLQHINELVGTTVHVRGKSTTQKIAGKFWDGALWNPDGVY
jgi:transposase-like protein